jgi:hypothetical protein
MATKQRRVVAKHTAKEQKLHTVRPVYAQPKQDGRSVGGQKRARWGGDCISWSRHASEP